MFETGITDSPIRCQTCEDPHDLIKCGGWLGVRGRHQLGHHQLSHLRAGPGICPNKLSSRSFRVVGKGWWCFVVRVPFFGSQRKATHVGLPIFSTLFTWSNWRSYWGKPPPWCGERLSLFQHVAFSFAANELIQNKTSGLVCSCPFQKIDSPCFPPSLFRNLRFPVVLGGVPRRSIPETHRV